MRPHDWQMDRERRSTAPQRGNETADSIVRALPEGRRRHSRKIELRFRNIRSTQPEPNFGPLWGQGVEVEQVGEETREHPAQQGAVPMVAPGVVMVRCSNRQRGEN